VYNLNTSYYGVYGKTENFSYSLSSEERKEYDDADVDDIDIDKVD